MAFRARGLTERVDDMKELTTGWTEPCSEDTGHNAVPPESPGRPHNNLLPSLNMSVTAKSAVVVRWLEIKRQVHPKMNNFILMWMESQEKFHSPQNISALTITKV